MCPILCHVSTINSSLVCHSTRPESPERTKEKLQLAASAANGVAFFLTRDHGLWYTNVIIRCYIHNIQNFIGTVTGTILKKAAQHPGDSVFCIHPKNLAWNLFFGVIFHSENVSNWFTPFRLKCSSYSGSLGILFMSAFSSIHLFVFHIFMAKWPNGWLAG